MVYILFLSVSIISKIKNVMNISASFMFSIVKGACPMPATVPVLEDPHQCSVRARAAAFAQVMDAVPPAPAVDPAELSLQGRRKLFEKHGEDALLPKAPFGQPVSARMLNSGGAATHKPPHRDTLNTRPVQQHSGSAVSRCREALEAAAATDGGTAREEVNQRHRELQALQNRFSGRQRQQQQTSNLQGYYMYIFV